MVVETPPLETVDFVDSRNHIALIGRTASTAPITLRTFAGRFDEDRFLSAVVRDLPFDDVSAGGPDECTVMTSLR